MEEPRLLDPVHPEVRLEFDMAEAEFAAGVIARTTANQMRVMRRVLAEAGRHPESLLDPASLEMLSAADRVDYARRAAAADLATRIGMAEGTVVALARQGEILAEATPRVWALFLDGRISAPNARLLADRAVEVTPERWYELDAAAAEIAHLAPARFAPRVRVLVERLASEPLAVRHRRALDRRRVCVDADRDGMSWLSMLVTDADAARVKARLDATADALDVSGEMRTRDQLRADAAVDLLTSNSDGSPAVRAVVSVTVPVLTLLGASDECGSLDGRVPIDGPTARRLVGDATSLTRLLTDPVSGTLLDVDSHSYRVPAALRRAVLAREPRCIFTGCGRRARDGDLDHTLAWADGGATTAANLRPLCRHHHRLKHVSRWELRADPEPTWTSPTGAVHRANDSPPF